MTIETRNLTKVFGDQMAVDHLSFQVESGGVVGLLGPNGAGKSTCMKMLTCFSAPTEGEAYICGKSIYDDSVAVRQSLGYLPENNPLYDEMYVEEYLSFTAGMYGIKKGKKSRIHEMIGLTGLEPERQKKIGALSKGFRQRVGLAQAMIHDPEVMILDEPTSGLDPNQVVEIRNLIREIGKEKTVILSSHIMQEVQAMCNRVVILNDGQMVADEETGDLMNRMAGQTFLKVRFKNSVSKESLAQIEAVKKVEAKDDYWLLNAESGDDEGLNEKVFQFAVEKDNPIMELMKEKQSLEQIFQDLTRQQEPHSKES